MKNSDYQQGQSKEQSLGRSTSTSFHFRATLALIILITFSWGFLTCMNDILIPQLKTLFELSYSGVMLVQFCFFLAYFIGSVPFGNLVHRIGYKNGIIAGLCVAGSGAYLFTFAAGWQSYPVFLAAFFVLALGISLLQVAVNPYASLLGPEKTAQSRLSLVQGFGSLGTTLAPAFGSILILSGPALSAAALKALPVAEQLAYRTSKEAMVKSVYLGFSGVLFLLALIVFFFKFPSLNPSPETKSNLDEEPNSKSQNRKVEESLWKHPNLVLGAVGIFAYVGSEVSIGSFLVSFLSDPTILGITPASAARFVSFYWGGSMLGRFIGSWVLTRIQPRKVLAFHSSVAAALVLMTVLFQGQLAMVMILSVGLFNSIMFPTIFTLALRNLGDLTAKASGMLCMAIVGGAIVPLLQGMLADQIGIQNAFVVPIACYSYVLFYALWGSRLGDSIPDGSREVQQRSREALVQCEPSS